jgi:hypothetical protein
MKRVIYLAKRAAAEIRESCRDVTAEDGGALFGAPEFGDVVAQVRAPGHTKKSRVVIHLKGNDFQQPAQKLLEADPRLKWLGYWHLHFQLDNLSDGDLQELARLHDSGRRPPCGIIMLLAIKDNGEFIRLRGWNSAAPVALEELDVREVDDPVEARRHPSADIIAPPMRSHALGLLWGASRLNDELVALEKHGVVVASHRVMPNGVALTFTHAAHQGELRCTLAAEGWEHAPKLEILCRGKSRLVLSPLGSMLSSWSSAYTLEDLLTYARTRGVWPRVDSKPATNQQK